MEFFQKALTRQSLTDPEMIFPGDLNKQPDELNGVELKFLRKLIPEYNI